MDPAADLPRFSSSATLTPVNHLAMRLLLLPGFLGHAHAAPDPRLQDKRRNELGGAVRLVPATGDSKCKDDQEV